MSAKQYNDIQELFASLEALRTDSSTTLGDVVTWFSEHMNQAVRILTGENHTPFGDAMSYDCKLSMNEAGYCQAEIDVNCLRSSGKRHVEFLERISSATDLVDIKLNHMLGMTIGVCYELNLDNWSNLTKSILSNSLYNLVVDSKATLAAQTKAHEDIDMILERYYPSLSKDFLMTAADLGVVTFDEATFVGWLDEHLSRTVTPATSSLLPDSFT